MPIIYVGKVRWRYRHRAAFTALKAPWNAVRGFEIAGFEHQNTSPDATEVAPIRELEYTLKVDGNIVRESRPRLRSPGAVSDGWPAPHEFLSLEEMAHEVAHGVLVGDGRGYFAAMKREDLITLHHGLGMHIRNIFGLWHPNNPNVVPGDLGDGHPDGVSMCVIERAWELLQRG